ncbi:hypothetical protein HNQ93_002463 [Hymenobacter luteus]|uniref:Uncharacterized protein n=2 Tax=Hymenobacter TaxID=89966 RepID=A0A7W9WC19_9BACT|nr:MULTISPECIES: hypothetical protein [Hymenobacter]MBB4601968.1 hypothetical protein [Hymenobacter latericoloratus]MBB6059603.1 hypothetical protein [Hymenobacter luteus]
MATRTAYQKQADKRTKDALKLRARFDARVRKYATALVAALAGAEDARIRINRLNTLYGVDISTETLLVHEVRVANLGGQLSGLMAESTPGAEPQLFNPTPNGNGGAILAPEAVFGEKPADGAPGGGGSVEALYDTALNGPNGEGAGVTLAASAGDVLRFNALPDGGSAPATMDVFVGGQQVASVACLDRYTGKLFSFTTGGVTHTGSFAAVVNFAAVQM